jgi:hypothetical protein
MPRRALSLKRSLWSETIPVASTFRWKVIERLDLPPKGGSHRMHVNLNVRFRIALLAAGRTGVRHRAISVVELAPSVALPLATRNGKSQNGNGKGLAICHLPFAISDLPPAASAAPTTLSALVRSVYVEAAEICGSRRSRWRSSASVLPTCRASVCPPIDLSTDRSRPGMFAGFCSTAGAGWVGAGPASLAGAGRLQLGTASATRIAIRWDSRQSAPFALLRSRLAAHLL